jgi:(E)-4-hydroxy-3-methylbut-2-enyl-diphosphate synthase
MHHIIRRHTPTVKIGNIAMGSKHPIVIQSMTNTPTSDIEATVAQIKELADAGSELVRITINDFEAAEAVPEIVRRLRAMGYTTPIIGDFHYNGHTLLTKYPEMAKAIDKYRINPGNVGRGDKHDENFAIMIKAAITYQKVVRIGVNWGSLDQELFTKMMDENALLPEPKDYKDVLIEAMIESALGSAAYAERLGLSKDKIVLSVKMSEVQDMIEVYQRICKRCDYVMHLGLTEAGGSLKGISASSAALGILLQQGYGDTIRMSLTPEPGVSRDLEVKACRALLQSMDFRYFMPTVTSCPGCGRTNSNKFVHLAQDVMRYIESSMPVWKQQYPGVEKMKLAVMGCVVNGPGESKYANIGISLPGSSEKPSIPVYQDGQLVETFRGDDPDLKDKFIDMVDRYVVKTYSGRKQNL